jgi:hypothetical protein
MKTKNLSQILGATLFAVPMLALAAAEAPTGLDMKYSWSDREVSAPAALTGTCPVHVVANEDARQNKETLGASIGGPLLSGDASRWVSDGLINLKNYGFTIDETTVTTPPRDGITVKTSLTRAYTWQVGLKIFSMVALKAQFIDKNGVLQEKYYRAHGDKTNMWGAASEYVTTLNYGLNNMLPVMASDLVSLCKGTKVEAYTYAGPDEPVKK